MDAATIYQYSACYNFYLILKQIYPEAEPIECWNDEEGESLHIISKIDGRYFDITGLTFIEEYKKMIPISEERAMWWEGNSSGMRAEWIISKRNSIYE